MEDKVNKILNEIAREQAALNALRKEHKHLQEAKAGTISFLTVNKEVKKSRKLICEIVLEKDILAAVLSLIEKNNVEKGLKQKEKVNLLIEELKKC